MNPSKKSICIAIGLTGAVLLGGTAAVLIMKNRKNMQHSSLFSCDHTEGHPAEKDIIIQETPTTEVNCDKS